MTVVLSFSCNFDVVVQGGKLCLPKPPSSRKGSIFSFQHSMAEDSVGCSRAVPCITPGNSNDFFSISLVFFNALTGEREKQLFAIPLIYAFIGCLVCALTGDRTHNLRISGQCSNQLNYWARNYLSISLHQL